MNLTDRRTARSKEKPIVGSLPQAPGILAAMQLSPALAVHLRGIADELLVKDFPGSTLTRAEREIIATVVSAGNDCFFCMDSHGAFAEELLRRDSIPHCESIVESVKKGAHGLLEPKMRELALIALTVRYKPLSLTTEDVQQALKEGASDGDVQLTILISAAFCMFNRMVDGLRAETPADAASFAARAGHIADFGYNSPTVTALPSAAVRKAK